MRYIVICKVSSVGYNSSDSTKIHRREEQGLFGTSRVYKRSNNLELPFNDRLQLILIWGRRYPVILREASTWSGQEWILYRKQN